MATYSGSRLTVTAVGRRQLLAELGVAGQGTLFVVIGLLAWQLATGQSRRNADPRGALSYISKQPLGGVLVGVLTVGLIAYAISRGIRAIRGRRESASKLGARLADAGTAVIYAGLAAIAIGLLVGTASGSGNARARTLTARVLDVGAGRVLVAGIGLVIIVAAVVMGVRQTRDGPAERRRASAALRRRTADKIYPVGVAARSVVFVLIGVFVVGAAIDHRSSEVSGMDGALRRVAANSTGRVLLFGVAVGLILFGAARLLMAPDILDSSSG